MHTGLAQWLHERRTRSTHSCRASTGPARRCTTSRPRIRTPGERPRRRAGHSSPCTPACRSCNPCSGFRRNGTRTVPPPAPSRVAPSPSLGCPPSAAGRPAGGSCMRAYRTTDGQACNRDQTASAPCLPLRPFCPALPRHHKGGSKSQPRAALQRLGTIFTASLSSACAHPQPRRPAARSASPAARNCGPRRPSAGPGAHPQPQGSARPPHGAEEADDDGLTPARPRFPRCPWCRLPAWPGPEQ